MKHISNKYLRILHWIVVLYCLHFLGAYIYGAYMHHNWQGVHDFPIEIGAIVGVQIVYEIAAGFWLLKKKTWAVTSVTFAFAFLESFLTLEPTNVYHSPYIAPILILVFLAGSLGLMWPIGISSIMGLGYLLGLAGFFNDGTTKSTAGVIVVAASFAIAGISYLVWKKFYISDDPKLNNLNTMLQSRQQQSEILIRSIADGVIVFDTQGKINLLNPAAAAMTEWKLEDTLGIDIHLVVKLAEENGKDNLSQDLFDQALTNKQPVSRTLQLTGRNNKRTIVSLVISPVVIPPQNSVVGGVAIFRDVTRERQAEQQRADFISTASHEMRTPVAAIEGYLALALNEKVSTVDSRAREYLIKAHESTEHLGKLFQDLLTSAKAEDGRLSNHPVIIEMGGLLEKLTDGLRFAAQKKNLSMELITGTPEVIDASSPLGKTKIMRPLYYVYADPERLREVITNLFDNAVKYTDQGTISIGLTGNDQHVQFYIRDTGPGIPPDDIPHLFQKFYRVDNSVTRTIGGTGLGLFISRKIIELYGGQIWAESKLGSGSTFYINLPRVPLQKAERMMTTESANPDMLASTSSIAA